MKKASMEVGVNFLVVVIICLVLLGIGFYLVNKFVSIGNEQIGKVNEYQRQQLQKALDSGEMVSIFPSSTTIEKGHTASFAIGIRNELDDEQYHYFSIYVVRRKPDFVNYDEKFVYIQEPSMIESNMQKYLFLGVPIPSQADKGTYVYNVYVCKDSASCSEWPGYNLPGTDKYGLLQQIQVYVK